MNRLGETCEGRGPSTGTSAPEAIQGRGCDRKWGKTKLVAIRARPQTIKTIRLTLNNAAIARYGRELLRAPLNGRRSLRPDAQLSSDVDPSRTCSRMDQWRIAYYIWRRRVSLGRVSLGCVVKTLLDCPGRLLTVFNAKL